MTALPMLAVVHVMPTKVHKGIRLWVPLFLVWLLLPVYFVVCAVIDIDPFKTLGVMVAVLGSLNGTHVEVESPDANVFIHVY